MAAANIVVINNMRIHTDDILFINGVGRLMGEYSIEILLRSSTTTLKLYFTEEDEYESTMELLKGLITIKE